MKKQLVILVMAAVITSTINAQSVPGGFQSPQNQATAGRIRSTADDFIRPDAFAGVKSRMDSMFFMTSFSSESQLHLGYAKKFDDLYIGAYYGGSLWRNAVQNNYTERYVQEWNNGSGQTVPVYDGLPSMESNPLNIVSVLIGLEEMGFRFTFRSTHKSFSNKDFAHDSDFYKSYNAVRGAINPQLAWSLTKNITPNGVRPWITLELNFNRNYTKSEEYNDDWTLSGVDVENSRNNFTPDFRIGLGGYTVYNKNNFRVSADASYALAMIFYNNQYSYSDGAKYQTKTIKGLNADGSLSENRSITNTITPSISGSYNIGNLALRILYQMPFALTNSKLISMDAVNADGTPSTSGNLIKNGADSKTTGLTIYPTLDLAAQWRIVPQLAFNLGGKISPQFVNRSTTKGELYQNGVLQTNSSYKTVTIGNRSTTNRLFAGASFNATNNITFEAVCGFTSNTGSGGTSVSPDNRLSVFDPDNGLFSFGSILVHLRF